jgi:hypothetical protein
VSQTIQLATSEAKKNVLNFQEIWIMKFRTLLTVLILGFSASNLAHGAELKLSCDGQGYELPADIEVDGSTANAHVQFDMVDDIADANYRGLEVTTGKNADGQVVTMTIIQSTAPGKKPGFRAVLHEGESGDLEGAISVISTDGDHLPDTTYVHCEK